ncbi:MAG: Fe-S cluster assembly protein HesB [Methanoregula sp.]|jgi:endonuclease-3 related protein|uniref:endonuclease III domain-containing protein n=1 Tax=Methanoregula sp. TaxID=2052170 RepID=UPI0025DDFC6B|nr:Fe-S cluster assembly protein HesB [Methanoregula sp.]MCK9630323.1 Fe-S cluster assembly protein HesB [Methanoregula sp.]
MSASDSFKVRKIVRALKKKYGKIPWWPGDCDEVMIGAILTQQTRWENVERALDELHRRDLCSLSTIRTADSTAIEEAIRCTGFYRIKAGRLKALATFAEVTCGGVQKMEKIPTRALREGLLGVHGIGEETADSILCYGFSRPVFVIDAYTDRMVRCAGVTEPRNRLKDLFESVLPENNETCRQTHAHIVEYAKEFCGKKRCDACILVNSNG